MIKDRGERRKIDFLHAIRKKKIDRQYPLGEEYPMYNNLHQYSKNKVHCSCPLCRGECWSVGKNSIQQLTVTDQKKMNRVTAQMDEINIEEEEI